MKGAVLMDLTADFIQPDEDCFEGAEYVGFASKKEKQQTSGPGSKDGPVSDGSTASESKAAPTGKVAVGDTAAPAGGAAA